MEPAQLVVEKVLGRSVVTSARGQGPLKLLTPENHGPGAWVFQSSLGGGFVGGDALSLDVAVQPGAVAFLSSQSAGKVYRHADGHFTLSATVADDAALVCWPDPLMVFEGARFEQRQRVELSATASLLLVDAVSAGRVASGERWAMARLLTRLDVRRSGAPLLDDAVLLDARHGDLRARLGPVGAFATVVVTGPAFDVDAVHARCGGAPLERLPATLVSASRWPWGLVLRCGAADGPALVQALRQLLSPLLVAALGEDPFARKW